jgi:predicted transcriptional regulator
MGAYIENRQRGNLGVPRFLAAFTMRKKLSEQEIDELRKLIAGSKG